MSTPAPTLAHLAEALRAHRMAIGAGRVPAALIQLESELLVALSGTACVSEAPRAGLAHAVLTDTNGAAEMLALSPRTIRSLRTAGRLQAVVIDTAVRYRLADLTEFAANNLEETTA